MNLRNVTKWLLVSILLIFILFVLLARIIKIAKEPLNRMESNPDLTCLLPLSGHDAEQVIALNEVLPAKELTTDEVCEYPYPVYDWNEKNEVTFVVSVNHTADYFIGIDYRSLNETIVNNTISVTVNGSSEGFENLPLESFWVNENNEVRFDQYYNQLLPRQTIVPIWNHVKLRDPLRLYTEPLSFPLQKGKNTITIRKTNGDFYLGNIYLSLKEDLPTYQEYLKQHPGDVTTHQWIPIEAEHAALKNDIAIRYEYTKSPDVSPYDSELNYINVVGSYFKEPGQKLVYAFMVEQDGYYAITLKYKNNAKNNVQVFRSIYIDGDIPFQELLHYPFPYTKKWVNMTLGNHDEPFLFYFEKGLHTLSIEVDTSLVGPAYETINEIVYEINELALELNKITGGVVDKHREWQLDQYLPEAKDKLDHWITALETIIDELSVINSNPNRSNELINRIKNAHSKLVELRQNYNKLPNKMNLLSQGSNSASLTLSKVVNELIAAPLWLDAVYIHSPNVSLPKPKANPFIKFLAGLQRIRVMTKSEKKDENTLEIWVNRSRFYIDLLQQMTDQYFTPKTGISVKFSVMPNEQKLIMANAAGTQPDAALGISGWLPYDLGIRGAAADLRQFDGFYELINNFQPGSLLHMIEDGKVYGLPETQDFYVTFYRNDIFDMLGLDIPETYEEIIEILPTLQRYGMNYYLPLSANTSLKPYAATAPFIFQHSASLYTEDGFKTAIDTEEAVRAITLMTDLYTLYSLPLQTSNFYDSFRNGLIPIGVSNFTTYIQLLFAAPELKGKWDIQLAPGVKQIDGSIKREYTGTAQSVVIFEKSKKKEEAWQFLQWWLSTEVQREYTYNLQLIYGREFLWNSANIEAFKMLPIPQGHIDVIIEQWGHIHEVPKTPGSYIIERELSNIWNRVVFDSVPVRIAIDDAVVKIDRELARKYAEFDYLDKAGNVLKPYEMPTIEMVREWQKLGQSKEVNRDDKN
ncbi:MAG TPA: extracellular solute-binding protein [Haloplasmataceae bacterium]